MSLADTSERIIDVLYVPLANLRQDDARALQSLRWWVMIAVALAVMSVSSTSALRAVIES